MKKRTLLILSLFIACGILFYAKMPIAKLASVRKNSFETFVKNPDRKIASYNTTNDEFKKARIDFKNFKNKNSFDEQEQDLIKRKVPIRNKRILIGESTEYFENENNNLEMLNEYNPEWKKLLGQNLLNFQEETTKVIVREEFPIIKVEDKKGIYMEQVVITFLAKNGEQSSYRAYVNSENGKVVDTWDRMIVENPLKRRTKLEAVPLDGVINK